MAMVSYTWETMPEVTLEEMERVHAIKDEDIDCSDIPEMTELDLVPRPRRLRGGRAKVNVNCNLDADIVAWLKRDGKEYQTTLNAILRRAMLAGWLGRAAAHGAQQ